MLETERCTRGTSRAFVRYEDLLADWPGEMRRIGEALALPDLAGLRREDHPGVDEFVDPTLNRSPAGWEQLSVLPAVRDMADDVWERVQRLAAPGGDDEALRAGLDAVRADYDRMYAEAEAIAQSSATLEILRARHRRAPKPPPPPPPPLWRRAARRLVRSR